MTKTFDVRRLSCPEPVLTIREAVKKENLDALEIILDNEAAEENVSRFLESQDFSVNTSREENNYKICAHRKGEDPPDFFGQSRDSTKPLDELKQKIMVLISTDRIGFGDDQLGKKLMTNFIKTIKEMGDELWRLVFVNNGVKLTVKGSAVLEDLINYEKEGVDILVCGTCLDHFDLLEAKKIGEITNMMDIVTSMQLSDKIINI